MTSIMKVPAACPRALTRTWEKKRRTALRRLVEACESWNDDPQVLNAALDAFTMAHIAHRFDLDHGPSINWKARQARALKRVANSWSDELRAPKSLKLALDELAIAHAALAFEGLSHPIQQKDEVTVS